MRLPRASTRSASGWSSPWRRSALTILVHQWRSGAAVETRGIGSLQEALGSSLLQADVILDLQQQGFDRDLARGVDEEARGGYRGLQGGFFLWWLAARGGSKCQAGHCQ